MFTGVSSGVHVMEQCRICVAYAIGYQWMLVQLSSSISKCPMTRT